MNDPQTQISLKEKTQQPYGRQIRELMTGILPTITPIVHHGVGFLVSILFLWLGQKACALAFGEHALFFDFLPMKYIFQGGDLLMLILFFRNSAREFR